MKDSKDGDDEVVCVDGKFYIVQRLRCETCHDVISGDGILYCVQGQLICDACASKVPQKPKLKAKLRGY